MRRGAAVTGLLGWSALIWWLSSLTPSKMPEKFAWFAAFGPALWNFGHFVAFGLLGAFAAAAFDRGGRLAGWGSAAGKAAFAYVLVYAFVDEAHQWTIPMRSCSLADVVVDGAGCAFVLLVPFGRAGENGRPSGAGPAVACLAVGVVLSWLGVTTDLPGDRWLSDALAAFFGPSGR